MTLSVLVDAPPTGQDHLAALLMRSRGKCVRVDVVGGTAADIRCVLALAAEAQALVESRAVPAEASLFDYQVFLPHIATNPTRILAALTGGICVIPAQAPLWSQAQWCDFEQGWRDRPESDFYAKLFPMSVHVSTPSRLSLGLGATINPRAIILNAVDASGEGGWVKLGRASHLGADCLLNLGSTCFKVGNFTMISANFSAHAMRHTLTHLSNFCIRKGPFAFFGELNDQVAPISVGHDVWVGERVSVLPGVALADGCIVGAGSVVTRSTEPYGIYAGNPARLIRYRFDVAKIDCLRAAEWWHYPYDRLLAIQESFRRPINDLSIGELKGIL